MSGLSLPLSAMLALRVEQGGRGLDEVERLQKEASTAWQGRQAGRPASHERRINIKEKISQWEGRSQQGSRQEAGVVEHPATVARTFSADLPGNSCSTESSRAGVCAKETHPRTKSVDLDFRESPARVGLGVIGRRSETWQKCPTQFSAIPPVKETLATHSLASSKWLSNNTFSTTNPAFSANGVPKVERISDAEDVSKPLPQSADDQDDNMPAGNFYTSRGFWQKLEGDRRRWESSRSAAGEALPPPKPQRTFQYCGDNVNSTGHTVQWNNGSTYNNNRSNSRRRRVYHPPSFPPPPCPVSKDEGLSRHKNNR